MKSHSFARMAPSWLKFNGPTHHRLTMSKRFMSFTFAGPRKLDELIKKDAFVGKTSSEVKDIWYTYHEEKDNVFGIVLSGECGKKIITRASECPFFVHPIFRENGYFTLVSQFQEPSHFLCAYLEDYKMDPNAATPLIAFSIFDDYALDKNITLVRGDVLNAEIEEHEGRTLVQSILDNYSMEDEFIGVKTFNKQPKHFDFDDYISRMKSRWKASTADE